MIFKSKYRRRIEVAMIKLKMQIVDMETNKSFYSDYGKCIMDMKIKPLEDKIELLKSLL
jgi:ribose 5-phosphate isomerase